MALKNPDRNPASLIHLSHLARIAVAVKIMKMYQYGLKILIEILSGSFTLA